MSLPLISYAVKFLNYFFWTDIHSFFLLLNIKKPEDMAFFLWEFGALREGELEDAEICPRCSPFLPFAYFIHAASNPADSSTFFWCSSVPGAQTLKLILPLVIIPAGCLCWGLKQKNNLNIKWNLCFDSSNPRGNCSEFVCDFYNTWPKTKPSAGRVHLPGK